MAAPGDTVTVQAQNATDMTTYGAYDSWAEFPSSEGPSFREVSMTYTIGCASSGCSEWDYTTKVMAMKPTGAVDSTERTHPLYRVNGSTPDSIALTRTPTIRTVYDSTSQQTDTLQRDSLRLVKYEQEGEGVSPADTVVRWPAAYYQYTFDTNGRRVDSQYVAADTIWQNRPIKYYQTSQVFEKMELASAITPYGGYMKTEREGFDNSWKRRYRFDVTDFRKFLRDSLKIRVFYDGYSSGFSASVNFSFIEGQASRKIGQVRNLYQGDFGYQDQQDFENNQMPEQSVRIAPDVEQAKVRVIASGHGFDNSTNCAEFCERNYELSINDDQAASQLMWRDDCGMNPTYPQAGTWLLDRANWCPGSRVQVYEHNVTPYIKSGSNTFDIDIDPAIQWTGEQQPSYKFAVQLITYSGSRHGTDAAMASIIAPSDKDRYARSNPAVMSPKVKVRNKGTEAIKQLRFTYGAIEGPDNSYEWEGTIEPMATKVIAFPRQIQGLRVGKNAFRARIAAVNGAEDDNPVNNTARTPFPAPPVLPDTFIAELSTNAQPGQNSLLIVDAAGDTAYYKLEYEANTLYQDTIKLPDEPGLYKLVLGDDAPDQASPRDENGLFYPFIQQAGQGSFSLREAGGIPLPIESFNANFGSRIVYHFATGDSFSQEPDSIPSQVDQQPVEEAANTVITVAPNPSAGRIRLTSQKPLEQLQVVDQLGRTVYRHSSINRAQKSYRLDLRHMKEGIYHIRAQHPETVSTQKVIIR
jgi:hypothetical protein